jgi:hypothetical protein
LRLHGYEGLWEGSSEETRRELVMLIEEPFLFMNNPGRRHIFELEAQRAGPLDESEWAVVSAWTEELRARALEPL